MTSPGLKSLKNLELLKALDELLIFYFETSNTYYLKGLLEWLSFNLLSSIGP